jgi:hypothetical protein
VQKSINVSASSASQNELNNAMKALQRQFKRELSLNTSPPDSDREQCGEMLSALLFIAAIKHLEAAGALAQLMGSSYARIGLSPSTKKNDDYTALARELHQQLKDFSPQALDYVLPCPTSLGVEKALALLHGFPSQSLWCDASCIASVQQVYSMTFRQLALDEIQVANKVFALDALVAFTQIYTPHWVTDFLLTNTLLPLVKSEKKLAILNLSRFDLWKINECQSSVEQQNIENLQVLDPACGAGNFLLSAYDLLKTLYSGMGESPEHFIPHILNEQIYGVDIDDIGLSVCCLTLLVKKITDVPRANIRLKHILSSRFLPASRDIELLGSISPRWANISNHSLNRKYDVVVTNPPYVGRRLISRELKNAIAKEYPLCRADLAAAFMEGSLRLLKRGGRLGVITQSSLLAIPSYDKFRQSLTERYRKLLAVRCGSGVFPLLSGEKADSVILIIENPNVNADRNHNAKGDPNNAHSADTCTVDSALRVDKNSSHSRELSKLVTRLNLSERTSQNGSGKGPPSPEDDSVNWQWVNHFSRAPELQAIASVKQGLATTNNARFVRFFWDVDVDDLKQKWVPYIKGAGSERWCAPTPYVVKWADNGREIKQAVRDAYPYLRGKVAWVVKNEQFYFKPGLCFSFINKSRLAVRRLPAGCIFDVASSAIFADQGKEDFLFGYLNSTFASAVMSRLNPTINVQVGDVKRLPLPDISSAKAQNIALLANQCYAVKRQLVTCLNSSFISGDGKSLLPELSDGEHVCSLMQRRYSQLASQLLAFEQEIDEEVLQWITQILALSNAEATKLRNWVNTFCDPRVEQSLFFNEKEFSRKLVHDLVGALVCDHKNEQILLLPRQVKTSESIGVDVNGNELAILCRDKARSLGLSLSLEQLRFNTVRRGVNNLARTGRGTARYLTLSLPYSGALLLFSRRAVSHFSRMDKSEKESHWRENLIRLKSCKTSMAGHVEGPSEKASDYSAAIREAEEVLHQASVSLGATIDWTTRDLITAIDQYVR